MKDVPAAGVYWILAASAALTVAGCSPQAASTGLCGNGALDPAEECDDGNRQSGDGCDSQCRTESDSCGDGTVQSWEACDDGNQVSGDGCRQDCMQDETLCGNGNVDPGEQCDDLNRVSCDGCSETCQVEQGGCCGNGQVEYGEECDDGNSVGGDGCSADCLREICGNARLEEGEDCDDGNTTPGDGCNQYCLLEVCGNDVIDLSEDCDGSDLGGEDCVSLGYYGGTLACGADCLFETSACGGMCGDGTIDASEQCDDGNSVSQDGCDENCLGESGICLVDQDLGVLSDASPLGAHVDTGASHALSEACGGTGKEVVLQITTLTFVDVTISYSNQTGHHLLGVFRAGQGDCDALETFCSDTGGSGSGSEQIQTLPPGTWLLIVDASGSGDEGSLDLDITAQDAGLPCDNQFGSDSYYLGCELAGVPFEDITSSGTQLDCSDDEEFVVNLPFGFSYYGVAYVSGAAMTVGCNGGVQVDGANASVAVTNYALPYASYGAFVAVFWDDLDFNTNGSQEIWYQTLGSAPNRRLVIQWVAEHFSGTSSTISASVVFFESTNIVELRYADVIFGSTSYDGGASATVGIQGSSSDALQYSFDTASLADGDTLVFYPQF